MVCYRKLLKTSWFTVAITCVLLLQQLTIIVLPVFGSSKTAHTDTAPLWELRIAATTARLPHYIGSNEYKNYFFPLPYLIYRGKFFQADRDNMRTIFFKNGHFETDLSLWGNPPVPDNNRARTDMDELDALVEIGPAVRYYFQDDGRRDALYLKGAIRTAFSMGWDSGPDIHYQGLHGSMHLVLKNSSLFKEQKMRFHLSSGLHFANSKFNNYFYEVGTEDVIPGRNSYGVNGGYSGFSLAGSITRQLYSGLTIGCYGRWDNISGAIYEDSPLVDAENNYSIGAMLIFTLARSKTLVTR